MIHLHSLKIKKKKIVFLFPILLVMMVSTKTYSQYNLVPNSSFEIFDTCPGTSGNMTWAPPWKNVIYYTTPDYFNACDTGIVHNFGVPANYTGYQFARTGVAYSEVVTYTQNPVNPAQNFYREYIEVPLIDSLKSGIDYCIQFYVSACDSNEYISNNIGIYFSPTFVFDTCPVGNACNLPFIPQLENPINNNLDNDTGWTLISGTYTAQGGEKFIIIGNFKNPTATLATYVGWGISGNYYFAQYYIDDVLIAPCDSVMGLENSLFKNELNVFPNPSNGVYTIENNGIEGMEVIDILGNRVCYQMPIRNKPVSIDITTQPKGIYFLRAFSKKSSFQFKLIRN